jgi:hypothetical protein
MARRLNARGEPLASPVTLGISSSVIGDEQLTYGGGQYLAVWQDGGRIVAARIDASGGVIDANPIAVRTITGASRLGAASDGHDFFVVWSERTAVFGAIVTSGGQVLPPRLLVTVSTQAIATEPVVTFDGTNYVAAYEVTEVPRVCGNPCRALTRIESVRIGHDGTTIDGSPVPVASDVAQIGRISIAGGGGNSLLAYTDGTNVFTTILRDGPTFIAATPSVVFSWTDAVAPSVIWTGSGYLLALRFTSNFYDPDGGSEWYVGAMRVAADGTRGDMTAIATGASADLALESAGVAALPGSAVFAVSEARNAGEAPRAVAYTLTELRPFTAPPVITPVPTPTPQPTPTPTPEPTPQPQPTPPPQPQPTPRAPSRPHAAPHQ